MRAYDDLVDLMGDDVALDEIGVVEDFAEDALGEQVLDDHLLHRGIGEIGVEGLAAEIGEVVEGLDEARVGAYSWRIRLRGQRHVPALYP